MKNICVYCGSSAGRHPIYAEVAEQFAEALAARAYGLVYGGARIGIMGKIADRVLALGGNVVGVMPQQLANKELAHQGLTELFVVSTMHERKAKMMALAQGFVALPGGYGTLEELFEVLAWRQLEFHDKPCGLLNVNGYYDALLQFIDTAVDEDFVKRRQRGLLLTDDDAGGLLDKMNDASFSDSA